MLGQVLARPLVGPDLCGFCHSVQLLSSDTWRNLGRMCSCEIGVDPDMTCWVKAFSIDNAISGTWDKVNLDLCDFKDIWLGFEAMNVRKLKEELGQCFCMPTQPVSKGRESHRFKNDRILCPPPYL